MIDHCALVHGIQLPHQSNPSSSPCTPARTMASHNSYSSYSHMKPENDSPAEIQIALHMDSHGSRKCLAAWKGFAEYHAVVLVNMANPLFSIFIRSCMLQEGRFPKKRVLTPALENQGAKTSRKHSHEALASLHVPLKYPQLVRKG